MIESVKNNHIKKLKKLRKSAKFRRQEQLFPVEGWKMVKEAVRHNLVRELYVSESAWDECERRQKCGELDLTGSAAKVQILSQKIMTELSDTVTPQGVFAVAGMPRYERKNLIESEQSALLCLENIQDPGNLGTMIRTAEGAGMSGIVLSSDCVDLFNPKVVRATMGSLFRVPYYICEDMTKEVERLREDGFSSYAAHLQGTVDYSEADYGGRIALLVGNEANGLTDELAGQADKKVKIPMEGKLESLNAAVSAALLMYEIHRNSVRRPG